METVYSRLRAWRFQQAVELQVPSFFILSNAHLAGVAAAGPTTLEELGQCPGVGPKKLAQFGHALLDVLAQCRADGLESGVVLPEPPPPPDLTDADVAEIASGLRQELARRVARRFKGRYSPQQVEEALRRISLPA